MYFLRPQFLHVNGRDVLAMPGEKVDVEQCDVQMLLDTGAALLQEVNKDDSKCDIEHGPGDIACKPSKDENTPPSGRDRRQRGNNSNGKGRNPKTRKRNRT